MKNYRLRRTLSKYCLGIYVLDIVLFLYYVHTYGIGYGARITVALAGLFLSLAMILYNRW